MELACVWVVLSLIVGIFAGNCGRSWFGWFVQALVISPVFSAVILTFAYYGQRARERDERIAELIDKLSK